MLDTTDRRLLVALLQDARLPLKELARQVGLSSPSVSERLRRLEERGAIRGYVPDVDPRALGFMLQAIVRVRPLPGQLHAVQKMLQALPELCECDKVTGDDCFVARLHLRSMEHLDEILDPLARFASTSSSIVKSQLVRRRAPPLELEHRDGVR